MSRHMNASQHTHTQFSHSICPECYEKIVKPDLEKFLSDDAGQKTVNLPANP